MPAPQVAVCVFAVELLLVFVQAAVFRRTPQLALSVGFDTAVSFALRAFWWTLPCFVVVSLRVVPPPLKLLAPALTIVLYVVYGTALVDLARVRRVRALVAAGNSELAAERAKHAARLFARNENDSMGARLTAALAYELALGRMTELGEKLLSPYEDAKMPRALCWLVRLELANYRVLLGRHDLARRAIDACAGPPPGPWYEAERACMLARLDAGDGQPARALAAAQGKDGVRWDVVRAHAFAALDRMGDAREALEAIESSKDPQMLRRVAAGNGPAASLAAQMLDDKASPYRG